MEVLRNSSSGFGFVHFDQAHISFLFFTVMLTGCSTWHLPLSLRLTSPTHRPISLP